MWNPWVWTRARLCRGVAIQVVSAIGLGAILLLAVPPHAYSEPSCPHALATQLKVLRGLSEIPAYQGLEPHQVQFLEEYFQPVTGLRAVKESPTTLRSCRIADRSCVEWPALAPDQKAIRIEWVRDGTQPKIVSEPERVTLRIPETFDFASLPDRGEGEIKRFLMGRSLHPQMPGAGARAERIALGESPLVLKRVQKDAIEAVQATLREGKRKFLFVAPTGTGKTEVLTTVLGEQLKRSPRKLHVLVADQNFLVDQLRQDISRLQGDGPYTLIQWGGEHGTQSIEELAKAIDRSDKPVVLVTTIQSLKARVAQGSAEANQRMLRDRLGTFVFDEVHHAGADQAQALIRSLVDHPDSKAFFYGTTATPMHGESGGVIQSMFDHSAFWAYLDTPANFMARGGDLERSVDEVVDQLAHAIRAGDLAPFDKTYFVNPATLADKQGGEFFVSASQEAGVSSSRYKINPVYHDRVGKRLAPLFKQHRQGFIATSTIQEAEALAKIFSAQNPSRKFAVLHSQMPKEQQADVIEEFRKGAIHFLVTVRKLDEGINFPHMTLFVDLNRTLGPRQFLQRSGRVLRLAPGKEDVDIVTFMEVNEENLRDKMALMDRILKGDLSSQVERKSVERAASGAGLEEGGLLASSTQLDDQGYREELVRLRSQLQEFWKQSQQREANPIERLAEFLRTRGREPSATEPEESSVYHSLLKLKKKPGGIELLPEDVRPLLRPLRVIRDRGGTRDAIIQFIRDHGRIPVEAGGCQTNPIWLARSGTSARIPIGSMSCQTTSGRCFRSISRARA